MTGADSSIEGDQIRFQVFVPHLAEEVKSLLALLSGSLDGWLPEFLTLGCVGRRVQLTQSMKKHASKKPTLDFLPNSTFARKQLQPFIIWATIGLKAFCFAGMLSKVQHCVEIEIMIPKMKLYPGANSNRSDSCHRPAFSHALIQAL